jgi:tRNA(His) 5'-end guanylyltransferase
MKGYEDVSRVHLPTKLPVIIRLDGKAFHTYTRGLKRPYSKDLMGVMDDLTKFLCNQIQNVKLAYTQSDEISLLLVDYNDIKTSSWFDANLQKMVSVAAGLASGYLSLQSARLFPEQRLATFDARAFVLPPHEVNNYFIWRQQDWNRNSLSMLAQSLYSHKELQNKGRPELHEMCFQKGVNWAALDSHVKDGRVVVKRQVEKEIVNYSNVTFMGKSLSSKDGPFKVVRSEWHVPEETPIFSDDRDFVNSKVLL